MAIDLLNSFLQRNQNVTSGQKGTNQQTIQATSTTQKLPQNLQVMRAIRALQAGQTIQGEVVSVKGNEVQLAILKDVIIDARLAQSMNLTPGISMPFQVKANNSQGLSLIPLFTNVAADPNALKALDMAQIPVNDRSLEMVQTLMEKGMSIDKQSVQEMYRDVVGFKDAPVKDIVALHQLEMPVSRENLTQLSLYQNNQHYLKDSFSNIGNVIGNQLEQLVAAGKTDAAVKLVNDIQQFFQSNNKGNGQLTLDSSTLEMGKTHSMEAVTELRPEMGEKSTISTQTQPILEETSVKEGKVLVKEVPISEQNQEPEAAEKQEGKLQKNQNPSVGESLDWNQVKEKVLEGRAGGKISALFEKMWNQEVDKQWLLEPEEVMEKKNVKEYFDKLSGHLKQLEGLFEDGANGKNPVTKAVLNTSSNLDFMNQLNQMHAYIQLPLKMSNQNAHGELYVFANRKNLRSQDGKITALLHLDMENLGKMDVYVALENNHVSTNFYLEKEEHLDFLEQHMDMLTARLQKRGYQCDIKTTLRNGEEESVMKTIEKQQGNSMLLSMQAFDVRA